MIDNELIVGTVHDLRVPLNGVKGHLHYLKNYSEDEIILTELEIIEKSCQDMEKLINTILDYSKLSEGAYSLEYREFSSRKLFQDVTDQAIASARMKGINLISKVSDRVPEILIGDEFRISLLIGNLVTNSLKYTPSGCIGIHADAEKCEDNQIELIITVVDTGNGIEAERAKTVFEAYSQAGSSELKVGGTGLGLYVIRQFALLMGGDIHLDNRPGIGCVFTLRVKVAVKAVDEINLDGVSEEKAESFVADIYDFAARQMCFKSKENIEAMQKAVGRLKDSLGHSGNIMEAECTVNAVKNLLSGGNEEVRRMGLKLAMAVRGEDRPKTMNIINMIEEVYEEE